MRKCWLFILFPLFLLSACSADNGQIGGALAMRQRLLNANGCSFTATVTADYGDKVYSFSMELPAM